MSRLLAIETSSEACSVALAIDGEARLREFHEPRRHAELLLPAVRELLTDAGVGLADLDAITFGRGPGGFTSLRIGIGVVQGLAWGAGLGVVPVSSLAALAQGAAVRHGAAPGTRIVTAMDARMGEIFHAHFTVGDTGLVRIQGEEQVSPPAALEPAAVADMIGVGNAFQRFPELAGVADSLARSYPELWPSAQYLVPLARKWLESRDSLPAHRAQPIYIRNHVADVPPG